MSDKSENNTNTNTNPNIIQDKAKAKSKKGKREPTSLHVDPELWQEVRVMAVLRNISVTEYFEDALRKKIDADNREALKVKEGYQVGKGGMYIPPPPHSKHQMDMSQREYEHEEPPISSQLGEVIKDITERYKIDQSEAEKLIETSIEFADGLLHMLSDPDLAKEIEKVSMTYKTSKLEAANYLRVREQMHIMESGWKGQHRNMSEHVTSEKDMSTPSQQRSTE